MMSTLWTVAAVCLCLGGHPRSETSELKKAIVRMQDLYHVNFVYDSSLEMIRLSGIFSSGKSLKENLQTVFSGTGIKWEIKGSYVLLFKSSQYTFSGHVCQDNGESLLNVTVYDQNMHIGTLTDEHGFFSLTLPEGKHTLRFSYVGYEEVVKELDLRSDYSGTIYLKESSTALEGVVVTADLNTSLFTTQTGKISLTSEQLNTEFSLFSSPDLVKAIQQLPGVSAGTELLSGLYVHGGKNDENLFLLDGMPLYQVNHFGGLFSAFNTDIVKNVDFYKSGFPARYGGRLSSVTDVCMKEGDLKEFHGMVSLGLLDGRLRFEGPVIKEKTSFVFGMRRSWLDVLSAPALRIANRFFPEEDINARYAFHDINAKITHRFSNESRLSFSVYSGRDLFKMKDKQLFPSGNLLHQEKEQTTDEYHIRWGNLSAALSWNNQFNHKLTGNFSLVYARNLSKYDFRSDDSFYKGEDDKEYSVDRMQRDSYSTIDDVGFRMDFHYLPTASHHVRFGSDYLYHIYCPQHTLSQDIRGTEEMTDTLLSSVESHYKGNEFSFYAEDDMRLTRKLRINLGGRYTMYQVSGAVYHSLEPRISASYRLFSRTTLKVSYTEMSQFAHQLSNSYLNLPTDCWVPSTSRIRPMYSRQVAGGVYMELPWRLCLEVESYFRTTSRMLEYEAGGSLTLPAGNWEQVVRVGDGKSYGLETSLVYHDEQNLFQAGYTLSWSKQKFDDFYSGWYPSKFDNRHKLNFVYRRKFSHRMDVYAAWTYRSGDHATVPTQYVENPCLSGTSQLSDLEPMYGKPNNITLPAYHRLDVGINFRRTTKRGFERIWNVSIYNAYCRMNPFYTKIERQVDGSFRGKAIGLFPIIPSFSYTLNF